MSFAQRPARVAHVVIWTLISVVVCGPGVTRSAASAEVDFVFLRETLEVERDQLRSAIQEHLRGADAEAFPDDKPGKVFGQYLERALDVIPKDEYPEVHATLRAYDGELDPGSELQWQALGVVLGDYLQVRYGDDLIRELRDLVAFETFHNIFEPNAENLEFHKAFRFLTQLAEGLGLQVQNHNFETLEVTLPASGAAASEAPVAMFTHIDVMRAGWHPVEEDPTPHTLEFKDDRWAGRGVYSDKGPTLINLFAMRVLRDANLQLARPVVLLIGSEANVHEATVKRSIDHCTKPPALVLAADGVFPYATGEKGNLLARVSSTYGMKSRAGLEPATFFIHKLSALSSTNTVPAESRAWVMYKEPEDSLNPSLEMVNKWRAVTEGYQQSHPVTRYGTYVQEDTLHFFSFAKPAHCESEGRNAIMDMAAVLVRHDMYKNSALEIMMFIDKVFQSDPTGKAAGLWFEHPQQGGTDFNPVQFDRIGDEVSVLFDIRWPLGHDAAWMRQRMQDTVDRFNREHGADLALDWEPGGREPVQIQPPADVADVLMRSYELASGDFEPPPAPLARSSCQLLPHAIPFGPEWPEVAKRGHTQFESISEREISDLGVAYVSALAGLATRPLSVAQ